MQLQNEILPSWQDTPTKQAILDFVAAVADESGPHYVPPVERIAVFDNDGTLWCEQPVPVQFFFAFDRVQALAPQHPEWKDQGTVRLAAQGRFAMPYSPAVTTRSSNSSWPRTRA